LRRRPPSISIEMIDRVPHLERIARVRGPSARRTWQPPRYGFCCRRDRR
jgi:hypothetical protein